MVAAAEVAFLIRTCRKMGLRHVDATIFILNYIRWWQTLNIIKASLKVKINQEQFYSEIPKEERKKKTFKGKEDI